MSKRNKEYKTNILSFLLGSILTLIIILIYLIITNNNNTNNIIIENNSLTKSINKVYDSVFYLESYYNDLKENNGTSFVYKKDNKYGYLITNEHVIGNGNRVELTSPSDEKIEATILGKDEYLDLAVLRIDKKYVKKVAILGNSEKEKIGNTVFTVGSPIGYNFRGSVTSGILSGKNRYITTELSSSNKVDVQMQVLQVDASINPGNSGGPLLNINGEVIGICTLKLVKDDIEGMGFAIPIEYAKSHITSLEQEKEIKWPKLGINITNMTDTAALLRNNIDINKSLEEGVLVTDNSNKTNNLKNGDIIIKVNGNKIYDTATLRYEIYKYKVGDVVRLTVIRKDKEKIVNVKLS